MDFFAQAGAAQHLGVKPLGSKEHNGKIRRFWDIDVQLGNRFCLIFNVLLQSFLRGFQSLFIGFFGSLANAYVVFLRELGVDGEPYGLAVFFTGGDLNGELDALGIIFRRYVAVVLIFGECLLQYIAELHLCPCSTRFYICQHALECGHIAGDLTHFAE